MRRWFWIIALGFCAFVFASLAITWWVWSAWDHELSVQSVFGGIVMLGFAVQSLNLCFHRLDGPLPKVEPIEPSVFTENDCK